MKAIRVEALERVDAEDREAAIAFEMRRIRLGQVGERINKGELSTTVDGVLFDVETGEPDEPHPIGEIDLDLHADDDDIIQQLIDF